MQDRLNQPSKNDDSDAVVESLELEYRPQIYVRKIPTESKPATEGRLTICRLCAYSGLRADVDFAHTVNAQQYSCLCDSKLSNFSK